jgi:serine/threonine protein kinase
MGEPGDDPRSAPGFAGASETVQAPPPTGEHRLLGDRYELLEEIGKGGAGRVYRAHDRVAGETIAVKVLAYEAAEETMDRIRLELRAARRVTHPRVVRLHDLMVFEGAPALTMEFVEGETLQALLAREPRFSAERLLALLRDLAEAVAAAHRAGVVHRDLKPANIIMRKSDGRPVVTDFGISRIAMEKDATRASPRAPDDGLLRLTEEGVLLGTPLYMAPEQLEPGAQVGTAADVYALGLLAWEAATGEALDHSESLEALMVLRGFARELDVRVWRPDLPVALGDIIARCLQFEPDHRFVSANELRAALESLEATQASEPGSRRRRRVFALGAAALASTVALAIAAAWLRPRDAREPSRVVSPPSPPPAAPWTARIRQLSAREQNLDRPALSPDARTIVVPSARAGHWDLWRFDPERDEWRALTDDAAFDASPQFIEAGAAIGFYSERAGKRGLYRVALDATGAPEFLEPAAYVNFGATRDGTRLFFSKDERDLWAYDFAARTATKLGALEEGARVLAIASDERGERLVVTVQRHPKDAKQSPESANDLYVFRVREGQGEYFTSDATWHGTAAFVPGAPFALVSSSRRGGLLNLWKIGADGAPRQLAAGPGDDIYAVPTWDGRALLYLHDQTIRQLFVRVPRATAWTRVTHEAIDHQGPTLDAAGKQLVFTTYDRDRKQRAAWLAEGPSFASPRPLPLPIAPIVVRILPTGDRIVALAAGAGRNELLLIERASGATSVVAADLTTTSQFSVAADGARVAFVDGTQGRVEPLGADSPSRAERFDGVSAVEFSPRRATELALLRVTSSPADAQIEVRELSTGRSRMLGRCAVSAQLAWAPDGKSIWIVPALEPMLRRIDARDGRVIESIVSPGDNTLSLAVANDGTLVAESTVGEGRLFMMENFDSSP